MGWTGYEDSIDPGMLFKRMYCQKCGNILKKKKISKTYKKGEKGYTNKLLGHLTIGMSQICLSYYIYKCPNCGFEITYDEQCIVAKKQKLLKKKVLDDTDL